MTINQFIKKHGITMAVSPTSKNPNMPDWKDARHWTCLIKCGSRKMHIYFSQGLGHKAAPTAADVLDCIAGDAAGIENARSFNEWASEYDYDTNSRKAERTYNVCKKHNAALKSLLGSAAYEYLLWDVERL